MLTLEQIHEHALGSIAYDTTCNFISKITYHGLIALSSEPKHGFEAYQLDLYEDGEEIVRWLIVPTITPKGVTHTEAHRIESDLNEWLTNYTDKDGSLRVAIFEGIAYGKVEYFNID